ncbi:hypothetical protein LTR94_037933, partial [Friedmanniomyces endolithicus]
MRFLVGIGRVVGLWALTLFVGLLSGGFISAALADGLAVPKQLGMQTPATPVMDDIVAFHNFLLIVITAIVIFVT